MSLVLPSYDFNSYSISHRRKITVFSYSQSVMSPGCVVAHDHWWNSSAWLFENMFPWHLYIVKAPGSIVHGLFTGMVKFTEIVWFIYLFIFLGYFLYSIMKKFKDCQGIVGDSSMKFRYNLIKNFSTNLILHFKVGKVLLLFFFSFKTLKLSVSLNERSIVQWE